MRAWPAPEFEAALEALRPAPRFGSFFGPTMREHVEFMKAMGYRYNVHHDFRREQRVHPAYQIGIAVCVALEVGAWLLTPTPVGAALARALAWVGRTGAGLY